MASESPLRRSEFLLDSLFMNSRPFSMGNRSPGVRIYGNLMPVSVHQWLRFVHLGLRSILVLFEQAR
ncbi:MAG: hypothetical protein L3J03_05170 [Desulfobacterales bacterium]|nr:hypothetical protein [Desulfobacterales bacterium]